MALGRRGRCGRQEATTFYMRDFGHVRDIPDATGVIRLAKLKGPEDENYHQLAEDVTGAVNQVNSGFPVDSGEDRIHYLGGAAWVELSDGTRGTGRSVQRARATTLAWGRHQWRPSRQG
jgi:hypothetical protein